MEALGLSIIIMLFINVILYISIILLLVKGFKYYKKNIFGKVMIWLAFIPIFHYSYQIIITQFEPKLRKYELSQLDKNPIKNKEPIKILKVPSYSHNNTGYGTLLASGIIGEIQSEYNNWNKTKPEVYSYKVTKNIEECLTYNSYNSGYDYGREQNNEVFYLEYERAVLARFAYSKCLSYKKEKKKIGYSNAQIEILTHNAKNRYTRGSCMGGGNNPLELRFREKYDNQLIDFWESPYFYSPMPILLPRSLNNIWLCGSDMKHYYSTNITKFVAKALGYNKISDFPKSKDKTLVNKVLKKLLEQTYLSDGKIIALLGQWESTIQIKTLLTNPKYLKKLQYFIINSAKLLLDKKEKYRLSLYPKLDTHIPTLIAMCKQLSYQNESHSDIRKYCEKIITITK